MIDWQTTINSIILAGAATLAITNIFKFVAKPTKYIKQKIDNNSKEDIKEVVNQILPEMLTVFSKEYDRKNKEYFRENVVDYFSDVLETIHQTGISNKEQIENNRQTNLNLTRQAITEIYYKYRLEKKLPIFIKENLLELYSDYIKNGGNHYVEKLFNRMMEWEVID